MIHQVENQQPWLNMGIDCKSGRSERRGETGEQAQLLRVLKDLVLRMPLNSEGETFVWTLQRFDCSISGISRRDSEARTDSGRGLTVPRVHAPGIRARYVGEESLRLDRNRVGRLAAVFESRLMPESRIEMLDQS